MQQVRSQEKDTITQNKWRVESYLYCGSSKLIAKHSRVEVSVEKANCSWAVCMDFEVERGKCSTPNGCIWKTGSRAEWS